MVFGNIISSSSRQLPHFHHHNRVMVILTSSLQKSKSNHRADHQLYGPEVTQSALPMSVVNVVLDSQAELEEYAQTHTQRDVRDI